MKNSSTLKHATLDILRASLLALVISLLLVLLFALIVRWASLDDTALTIGNYVIKALSLLAATLIGFKDRQGGAVKGGITGIVYMLLSVFVFAAADGFKSANFNFADLFTTLIAGIISGIIAVNIPLKKGKKLRTKSE